MPSPNIRYTARFVPVSVVREDPILPTAADSPECICNFWREVVAKQPDYEPEKESSVVILLSARMLPFAWHRVALGSVSECPLHPREVLRPAIIGSASSFVVCHNHPSGDPSPSPADTDITKRIREASEVMGLPMIDHVICTDVTRHRAPWPAYFSFKESGII